MLRPDHALQPNCSTSRRLSRPGLVDRRQRHPDPPASRSTQAGNGAAPIFGPTRPRLRTGGRASSAPATPSDSGPDDGRTLIARPGPAQRLVRARRAGLGVPVPLGPFLGKNFATSCRRGWSHSPPWRRSASRPAPAATRHRCVLLGGDRAPAASTCVGAPLEAACATATASRRATSATCTGPGPDGGPPHLRRLQPATGRPARLRHRQRPDARRARLPARADLAWHQPNHAADGRGAPLPGAGPEASWRKWNPSASSGSSPFTTTFATWSGRAASSPTSSGLRRGRAQRTGELER